MLSLSLRPRSPLIQSLCLLARWGVEPLPGESFPHLCRRAAKIQSYLAPLFQAMADQQQLLANAPLTPSQRRHHSRQWRQLRSRLAEHLGLSERLPAQLVAGPWPAGSRAEALDVQAKRWLALSGSPAQYSASWVLCLADPHYVYLFELYL
ncbi:hypothetical protein OBA47_00755 [bacterium]|nr:hypothetical protein [bacterium]